MYVLPAIDLKDGKCVRLIQGDYDRQINYHDDPVAQARLFEAAGASWLHVVDLDGALKGGHYNIGVLARIRRETRLKIELGGGVRSEASVRALLDSGITRVIVGTQALKAPDWFKTLVHAYPGQIVLGLDARDGLIATQGWTETGTETVETMAAKVKEWPLAAIVYTDIACDGMMTGPNIEATGRLARYCQAEFKHPVEVIASGGVGSLEHLRQVATLPVAGVIVGRALYEGKVTLAEALAVIEGKV